MKRFAVPALLLLFFGACAKSITTGSMDHSFPTGSSELVLRIKIAGGFMPATQTYRNLPAVSLMGDGLMVAPGPQIEIYPPPAIPNLRQIVLTREGVSAVVARAVEVGLLDKDREFKYDRVADAPTTTILVNANSKSVETSVYALGLIRDGQDETVAISQFVQDVTSLVGGSESKPGWFPDDGFQEEEKPYPMTSLKLFAFPSGTINNSDEGYEAQAIEWPLVASVQDMGSALDQGPPGGLCLVLRGNDATVFLQRAAETNQLTQWKSGSVSFELIIRPLLPDEPATCIDPELYDPTTEGDS